MKFELLEGIQSRTRQSRAWQRYQNRDWLQLMAQAILTAEYKGWEHWRRDNIEELEYELGADAANDFGVFVTKSGLFDDGVGERLEGLVENYELQEKILEWIKKELK